MGTHLSAVTATYETYDVEVETEDDEAEKHDVEVETNAVEVETACIRRMARERSLHADGSPPTSATTEGSPRNARFKLPVGLPPTCDPQINISPTTGGSPRKARFKLPETFPPTYDPQVHI